MEHGFKERDKKHIIEFLNFVAEKAVFTLNTQQAIRYRDLLAYMQTELLPKVDSHMLEVVAVHEPEDNKGEEQS